MSRLSRGNSLVRGSGHGLTGNQARRGSIMKPKRRSSFKKGVQGDAVYDLILLQNVSEDAVIQNLTAMFDNDMIYSYIGNVVISVNPFMNLPIYDDATIARYKGRSAFDPKLPPHIFALADNVFSDMKFRGRDQVVIISGESGSGKTEASKKIMQYVAAVSGSSDQVNAVKNKLLHTNPVLEAFGNAKTVRNDNSSRFGKYMDIQFDFHGEPVGGHITTFLLEKARVIRQGDGERNFHIFYQLLAGGEAAKLGMPTDPMEYHYLNQGNAPKVRGMNDQSWWKEMVDGLKYVGFSDSEKNAMFQAIGAVLMLGQVTFEDGGQGAKIKNQPPILAKLLGASAKDIEAALTHNTVIVNRQQMASDLNAAQAVDARDALAKAMYSRLFRWVYEKVNDKIQAEKDAVKAVIGVLDIYGFEILGHNSFEQFCINYCNEKLQQLFIELTLKTEQDEYLAEGIKWTPIEFFNNKVICDLVESRPQGIIALLDEESIRPGDKSDMIWLDKMAKALNTHKHFKTRSGAQDRSLPEGTFKLVHYAGDVVYHVNGFLDKNTDTLFKDLSRLMFNSSNQVFKEMFPEGDESTWAGASKRPPTAGRNFVNSMQNMINMLNTKIPSYVRCIKPNHQKQSKRIDDELLRHQVKYLGLVENVRVRRAGFCFRETQKDFFWRYKMLSPNTYPRWSGTIEEGCHKVFADLGIGKTAYEMGKTKVFIKNPVTVFKLEEERDEKLEEIVSRLQLAYRLYRIRKTIKTYFNALIEKFTGVEKDPHWGRSIEWPPYGPILAQADDMCKRVYKNWWARKMVGTLTAEQQAIWRVQLLAHGFFAGKKQGFSIKEAGFQKNYFPDQNAVKTFSATHQASEFDATIEKITRKGKAQKRVIVLTKTHVYKLDTGLKATPKRVVDVKTLKSISVSKYKDNLVVVHSREEGHDMVFNLGVEGHHAAEFVSRLYISAREAENKLPVEIKDEIEYNNTTKPGASKRIRFRENPSGEAGTIWKGGNVLYA